MVIVSCVQGNLASPARIGNGPHDFDGLVAIERRYLDGDDILDFGELPPELVIQRPSSDCRLQVEADDGKDRGDGARMVQKLRSALVLEIGET